MKITLSWLILSTSALYAQGYSDAVQPRANAYYKQTIRPLTRTIESYQQQQEENSISGSNSSRRLYGRHVCSQSKIVMHPVSDLQSYCKPNYQSYMKRCENDVTRYCTGYRVAYTLSYRNVQRYISKTESLYACCPGWTHTRSYSPDCKKATCKEECQNGGLCIKPNICSCLPGWTGKTCSSDVNECSIKNGGCEQQCLNIPGSYKCSCRAGYILQADSKNCQKAEGEDKEKNNEATNNNEELSQNIEILQKRILALEDWQRKMRSTGDEESRRQIRDESFTSLSRHLAILEQRLAECSCEHKDSLSLPGAQK